MIKQSAGLLLFREADEGIELFLVHPGGPFYKNKDIGVWSIPKGEFDETEDALTAARREFEEETGFKIAGDFFELEAVKQKGGKMVYCWGVEADVDAAAVVSNTFPMEWPPKSGRTQEFPEVDRAGWFTPEAAKEKILPSQLPLIASLLAKI
jgi:predicted NUDIX family NTP pyrophosphohydrolase